VHYERSDLPARLKAINWFSRCGEIVPNPVTMPIIPVSCWGEAMESCAGEQWENLQLHAHNQLTLWLHHYDRVIYQSWNDRVAEFKSALINPLTIEKWEPLRLQLKLTVEVVHCLQWDILGALLEDSYLDNGHPCRFFLELLTVYEAGQFPCGWDGDWPMGSLIVY
jgi:hypothetical protein